MKKQESDRQSEAGGEAGVNAAGRASSALRHAKIMMVDDDALVTEVVRTLLEERGCAPLVGTDDPVTAFEKIKREKPDVLLLDLLMPATSGFDILAALRADPELKPLRVIVLTAAADESNRARAIDLGASEVIAKPIEAAQLFAHLERLLAVSPVKNHDATAPPRDS